MYKRASYIFSVKRFGSEGEMEDYVKSEDYDKDSKPRLCSGIVIEGNERNYHIKLRFDDNVNLRNEDRKLQVPTTKSSVLSADLCVETLFNK